MRSDLAQGYRAKTVEAVSPAQRAQLEEDGQTTHLGAGSAQQGVCSPRSATGSEHVIDE